MKINKYRFSYGRSTYHLSGASNHFSLSVNLSEFYKKDPAAGHREQELSN